MVNNILNKRVENVGIILDEKQSFRQYTKEVTTPTLKRTNEVVLLGQKNLWLTTKIIRLHHVKRSERVGL